MSANYNTSLFRQLQAPLLDALGKIEGGLQKLLSNQVQPGELGLIDKAHEVTSSLKIVKRNAVAALAETIEQGVASLNAPEQKGWDYIRTQSVARALLPLVSAFTMHLRDMGAGNDMLHVHLWPMWAKVCEAMEMPVPPVEALFEIDPDFSGETFQPRPPEHLKEVASGAHERLLAAIGLAEVARNRADMENSLRKATEVFNQVYSLRHHRAYQPYWLIVRARLAVGLLMPDRLLDSQEEWLALLREASIQLRKFGADSRRLTEGVLQETLKPLMKPWPKEWALAHPTLAELDRRLGLSVFWQAAKDVREEADEGALAQFSVRQKDLSENIGQLKNHWNKLVSAPEEQRKSALAGFLRSLVAFGPKKEWFPGDFVSPLFEGMKSLGDKLAERLKMKDQPPVDERLAFEVAATVLLFDEVVERRGRWHKDLEARCQTQAYRLSLAVNGRYEDLAGMPVLGWDAKWRERQVDKAIRDILGLVQQQIGIVERALVDLSRGDEEEEVRTRSDELKGRCRQVGLVLMTLRQPLAAKLTQGIREKIELLLSSKTANVPLSELALALASLQRFLQSKKNGDAEDLALLAPGLDAVFGQGAYAREIQELHDGNALSPPVAALEELSELAVEVVKPHSSAVADKEEPLVVAGQEQVEQSAPSLPAKDLRSLLLTDGAWDSPSAPDILEIFLEEADVALEEAKAHRKNLLEGSSDTEEWLGLRRQFHTLKGSGRICGLVAMGEVAWWVEDRLNEALATQELYSPALDDAIEVASRSLSAWYEQLRLGQAEVLVQATSVREALDQAIPFFGSASSTDEAVASQIPSAVADEDFSNIWPSGLAEAEVDSSDVGETTAETQEVSTRELLETADNSASTSQLLDSSHDDLAELVRQDADKHAKSLAEVLLSFELGGRWNWENLHWSAHTLAGLVSENSLARMLAKRVEEWAEQNARGVVMGPMDEAKSMRAIQSLMTVGEALAEGQEIDVSQEVLDAFELEPALAEDDQEWSLDLGDVEVETLDDAGVELVEAVEKVSKDVADVSEVLTTEEPEAVVELLQPVESVLPVRDAEDETLPVLEIEGQEEPVLIATEAAEEKSSDEAVSSEVDGLLGRPVVEGEFESVAPLMDASMGVDVASGEIFGAVDTPSEEQQSQSAILSELVAEEAHNQKAEDSQPLVSSISEQGGVFLTAEELEERDLLWQDVFDALKTIQQGFALLSNALLKLNEQDDRD